MAQKAKPRSALRAAWRRARALLPDWKLAADPRMRALADLARVDAMSLQRAILRSTSRRVLPKRIDRALLLPDIDVAASGVEGEGGPAYVRLRNGLEFWGPQDPRWESFYRILADLAPVPDVAPAAYALAVQVQARYRRASRYHFLPAEGGVLLEAGAKRGYQALGFAERLGPAGRLIAVEMDERDYRFMRRSFDANPAVARLEAIHGALWSREGERKRYGANVRTVHSGLREVADAESFEVGTLTLSGIIEARSIERVDFLNVMVNGAELEVLKGLEACLDRVKVIRIASYYSDAHGSLMDQCARFITERGGKVLRPREQSGQTYLVTARFAAHFGADDLARA